MLYPNTQGHRFALPDFKTGAARIRTTVLLTPEEIDQAVKAQVDYNPPG
jgi:hypothetical protein